MLIGDESNQNNPSKNLGNRGDVVKEASIKTFQKDVLEQSMNVPVIVDFWAPWCEPCKQLGPILEKLVVGYAGKVRMVKVNVDENQAIASQLQVQSLPTVYAFKEGRPVDAFMGSIPESEIKTFLKKVVGDVQSNIEILIDQANGLFENENYEEALSLFQNILVEDKANLLATAGILRCYLELGEDEEAKKKLDLLPRDMLEKPEISAISSSLELKQITSNKGSADEISALEKALLSDSKNSKLLFDLSLACYAAGEREKAVDALLKIITYEPKWNDDAARKQLIKFFDVFGEKDNLTISGRSRLSAILFS